MQKDIYKDGKGNIIVSEDFFSILIGNIDSQQVSNYCRSILYQPIVIETKSENYYLTKRYSHQSDLISWYEGEEIAIVNELFKDTVLKRPKRIHKATQDYFEYLDDLEKMEILCCQAIEQQPEPFHIETSFKSDGEYLTISEDGQNNRPWTEEEINKIREAIDYRINHVIKSQNY